jgi:hypothetical protein
MLTVIAPDFLELLSKNWKVIVTITWQQNGIVISGIVEGILRNL